MKIGRPDGWWNREVPLLRISLIVGALLFGLFVWLVYGDLIGSVVWGVRRQRTASFRGQTLQVPWFWREKEWTNYNEFELTRSGVPFDSLMVVRYENSTRESVQRSADMMRKSIQSGVDQIKTVTPQISVRPIDFYGDDFTKSHYVCLDEGIFRSSALFLTCYSRDGRWSVSTFGVERDRSDFEMILRGVAAMGNPSK